MWLTALSIRRPLLILMAVMAIMLGGIFAYGSLGVDLLPSVKFPYVAIFVTYPGAGPREVESRVTKPIENAVAGAPNVKVLSSTSADGYSLVLMQFNDGVDPDIAIQDIQRRVNQIRPSLPDDILEPTVSKSDPNAQPILVFGVNWDRNPDGVFRLVDDTIRPRLEAVDGVASVRIMGGREREIHVIVDRARLEAHGLSLAQVNGALASANLSSPSGFVEDGSTEYNLRVYGLYQNPGQLNNLVLGAGPGGAVIRLRDVARVEDGFKKATYISRSNGREGVGILLQKQSTANTVAVADGVQKALKELQSTFPPGVEIATVMNGAHFVRESVASVQTNLRDAAIITALVLLLFLHTWRSTLIVLISIPTSLLAAFGIIWALGFSINMMSMMAMALTIGILVDDSIVILENIYRHVKLGEKPRAAAITGRAEIGAAAVAITLVDVVVYTPVAFLTGIVGQFFKEFGGTIVVATLFSLLVSFTLTPMLASRWLAATDEERSPLAPLWLRWEQGYEAIRVSYRRLLDRALGARWLVLCLGLLAFLAGLGLVGAKAVTSEFIAQSDQGQFTVLLEMPVGTSLQETNRSVQRLESQLAKIREIDAYLSTIGTGGSYGMPEHRSSRTYVSLKPVTGRSRSVFDVAGQVRSLSSTVPGGRVRVDLPSVVGYTQQPVMIRVRGPDIDVLSNLASQVEDVVRKTPGTVDVSNSAASSAPEMRLEIDHERLSDLGLTTAQVASALRTAFEGNIATELRPENEDKVDVRVMYAGTSAASSSGTASGTSSDATASAVTSQLAAIPGIPLTTARGIQVKLDQVARLVPVAGPAAIDREDRMRQIAVAANLGNRPLGDVSNDIRNGVNALSTPPGYRVVMAGDTELQDESFSSMVKALGVSVVLMYMLMAALYDSLVFPLVIMGALPVASFGAIGALAITGDTLNIMSLVGLIMLTGLVAKNAILVVDYTNTLRKRGYGRREALLEAAPTRLRPVLMTTVAMVFAMMPLAMKTGEGAATRAPLAIVVIGGLVSSTLLTLVVVPAAYTVLDDLQEWVRARLGLGAQQDVLDAVQPVTPEPRILEDGDHRGTGLGSGLKPTPNHEVDDQDERTPGLQRRV